MTTANNHSDQPNTEQLRELLSPYLDGEVTAEERVLVEEAIASSPELRRDLETLRQTVSLLQTLPPVSAPRPFTLSETKAGPRVPPPPRRGVTQPPWLRSWGVAVATFLCVLAIGGVFLVQQFGGGLSLAPAEIALEQQAGEPAAAPAEEETTFDSAPTEIVVEKESEVEAAAEAEQPAVELAEGAEPQPDDMASPPAAEEAAPADQPQAEEAPEEAEQEALMAAEEPAEDTASAAGEAAEAEEAQPEEEGMEEAAIAKSADEAIAATPVPAGTPPPVSGMAVPTASPAAAAQEAMPAEEGVAQSASPPPAAVEIPPEQPLERQSLSPRPVEIQNQAVAIRPGAIEIEGQIDAPPESMLLASLHRNGEPFDLWADPASLRTLVQPEGHFSFTIQARPGVEQNLLQTEPAEYRVDITAVGVEEPVIASIFFDTTGPANPPTPTPTVTPLPTATVTPPPPSPTVEERATDVAAVATPPAAGSQPDLPAQPTQQPPPVITVVLVGLAAFGVLALIGLTAWWLVRKRQG